MQQGPAEVTSSHLIKKFASFLWERVSSLPCSQQPTSARPMKSTPSHPVY